MRLAGLTTLRVGGPASRVVSATTTDELVDAVREVDDADEPLLLVAGGSNLLVSDAPVPGTVVRVLTTGITVESSPARVSVRVAAGESWDALVARAVAAGWVGLEALSGIPGSVGATPVQNVGAYGQEVADTVASVRVWDRLGQQVVTVANTDCRFTYRHSAFKGTDRYVVLEVVFELSLGHLSAPVRYAALAQGLSVDVGARAPLADVRAAVLDLRRRRGMVLDDADHDTWSAGSFFTNPVLSSAAFDALPSDPPAWPVAGGVKTSAAWLIEQAGFARGHGLPGPAALSTKHPLAVTNRGTATADDVLALAREVRDGVRARFGVELVPEPVLVGCSL